MTEESAQPGQATAAGKKWFYGCAIGCSVVALGLLILAGIGLSYLERRFQFLIGGLILLFIAGGAVATGFQAVLKAARANALKKVAAQMGFTFRSGAIPDNQRPHTPLFRQVIAAYHPMRGRVGDREILVLDLRRKPVPSEPGDVWGPTAVVLPQTWVGLPDFSLSPKGVLGRALDQVFGSRAIDFADQPEFCHCYRVEGQDEEAVRRMFNTNLRAFLMANPGWHIQTGEGDFVVYHTPGSLARPREVPELVAAIVRLREAFG